MTFLRQVLGVLGFGAPILYALAVYGLFHFWDKNASAKAKRAISSWCESEHYQKADAAAALTEIFDRLYTAPLLGWRAMVRSAIFSITVTALLVMTFAS